MKLLVINVKLLKSSTLTEKNLKLCFSLRNSLSHKKSIFRLSFELKCESKLVIEVCFHK